MTKFLQITPQKNVTCKHMTLYLPGIADYCPSAYIRLRWTLSGCHLSIG